MSSTFCRIRGYRSPEALIERELPHRPDRTPEGFRIDIVHIHGIVVRMTDTLPSFANLSDCLILNTIRTARTLMRRYDNRLKRYDITVIQFTVMALIRKHADTPINALADQIAMDRTTLTRNLDVLVRKGLAEKRETDKGNAKVCALTASGDQLLDTLLPEWVKAQQELAEILRGHDPDGYLQALRLLERG